MLIIFQGIGWFLAWQSIQLQSKYAAHRAMFQEKTPVRQLVISQVFFQASKVGRHEINLDGDLYDIRSSEKIGDSIRLVLYHDWHEQALYSILDIHFSKLNSPADPGSKPVTVWVAQWLGSTFILPVPPAIPVCFESRQRPLFSWYFPTVSGVPSPPFTPPRNCF